jgi:hypothetical protein
VRDRQCEQCFYHRSRPRLQKWTSYTPLTDERVRGSSTMVSDRGSVLPSKENPACGCEGLGESGRAQRGCGGARLVSNWPATFSFRPLRELLTTDGNDGWGPLVLSEATLTCAFGGCGSISGRSSGGSNGGSFTGCGSGCGFLRGSAGFGVGGVTGCFAIRSNCFAIRSNAPMSASVPYSRVHRESR